MYTAPVLVTGGAGFIGSNLVDALLASGYGVRVLDNLSTGKRSNLPENAKLELVVGDTADRDIVNDVVCGCSAVVHLAAVASVQASVDDPVKTNRSNLVGTIQVCEAMKKAGIRRIVYASSAAVYGDSGASEAIDEDAPKVPLTPYAADKLAGEHYLGFYRRQCGLEPVLFRFFNIYGPRQDPSSPYSGVISIFTERARRGLPITVFGDGGQSRDFVYVGDLVDLLVQSVVMRAVPDGAVNVGLNRSTSLNDLLCVIRDLCGGLPDVNYDAARCGDVRHSLANNARLRRHFCVPDRPVGVREGLARLMAE